ncbi:MAG TPA: SET domain-containing protein-lysine N-methyltransferase [Hanamia sp.]|nr:SET domain-containing protein-lysine N-methyltransferase [Hanamia sp.]
MSLLEKQLIIKPSTIPGAGLGLFTTAFIPAGTRIIQYKGRITTWKDVLNGPEFNAYVYYISRNHVIDAMKFKKSLGRYANDAMGLSKTKGITNNTIYVVDKKKVYMEAKRDIPAGSEILVSYGKEYWDVIRENIKLQAKELKSGRRENA